MPVLFHEKALNDTCVGAQHMVLLHYLGLCVQKAFAAEQRITNASQCVPNCTSQWLNA